MTSALAEMTATASTPDGRAFATISGRTHVRMSLAPGYYEWASVTDLERQLTRLAKLLFVARMRAYYEARSQDFEQLFTREPAPTTPLDEAYVRARPSRRRGRGRRRRRADQRRGHGLLGGAPGP